VGELEDAIREHLELKRRRGADPGEVAREEEEALAPVTRGHAVVVSPPLEHEERELPEPAPATPAPQRAQNGAVAHDQDSTPERADDDLADATQEYVIAHEAPPAGADWLEDEPT